MQTVNFQCGHCKNLMAVGADYLGQQVRCPHCQQVVVAPPPSAAAAPPPPPPPAPMMLPPSEPTQDLFGSTMPQFKALGSTDHEDIFAPPSDMEDDLFSGPAPRMEIPRDPRPPAPLPPLPPAPQLAPADNGDATLAHVPTTPAAPPENESRGGAPIDGATLTYNEPPGGANPFPEATGAGGATAASPHSWMDGGASGSAATLTESGAPGHAGAEGPGDAMAIRPPRVRRAEGSGWFVPVAMITLVVWAVLATAIAAYATIKASQLQKKSIDPFDRFPDLEGDNPGVRKQSTGAVIRFKRDPNQKRSPFEAGWLANMGTRPLPEHLIVPLGEKLTVGDLEVQPLRVYRKKLKMFDEGSEQPEDCQYESLVLELRLRNVSSDNAFTPLDNYFDRRWKQGEGAPPFTLIEAGKQVFYGGPARWLARSGSGPENKRQWLDAPGRKKTDPVGLKPGEVMVTTLASNGEDKEVADALFGGKKGRPYQGPLLWRVQVRRGLVAWRGRDLPATAVIGVRFTDKDVKRGAG